MNDLLLLSSWRIRSKTARQEAHFPQQSATEGPILLLCIYDFVTTAVIAQGII